MILLASLTMHVPMSENDRKTRCEWLTGCPTDEDGYELKCDSCPARWKIGDATHKIKHSEAATFWMGVAQTIERERIRLVKEAENERS